MSQYYLFQDQKKCIGCLSCEVHCKSNKGLPLGPRLGQMIPVGPKMMGELPEDRLCLHALLPLLRSLVRAGVPHRGHAQAAQGRHRLRGAVPLRGLQELHYGLPLGCAAMEPATGKVVKCDYCMDRIDQGLKPACVSQVRHPLPQLRPRRAAGFDPAGTPGPGGGL